MSDWEWSADPADFAWVIVPLLPLLILALGSFLQQVS